MAVTAQEVTAECVRCLRVLPASGFTTSKQRPNGLYSYCRECQRAKAAARYWANPEPQRERSRWASTKHRYGLTQEQFEALSAAQDGKCAICGQPESDPSRTRLTVDHDHACCPNERTCGNCVRGLVCNACNRLLGIAGDDPQRLRTAAAYLGRWSQSRS